MRLVDADALYKKLNDIRKQEVLIHGRLNNKDCCTLSTALFEIECAPTIEPQRKKGHWIRHPEQRNIFNGKTIECSECHEKYTVQYVEDELFCRHCGADMREPEDIPMEYFESGGR